MNKLFLFALLLLIKAASAQDTIKLADPTIFYDGGVYYLYGTGSPDGFPVYTSNNLKDWHRAEKNALTKGEAYGDKGFWAPQVFKHKGKYYMAYTANEHIAIAVSDSPLGPFKQDELKSVSLPGRQIDPFIFKDTNGDLYLYHVRLQNGNRIFVVKLKKDLTDVADTLTTECLNAQPGWENTANAKWPVAEGPTVIKIKSLYYLFYSANDFRNIDYAVGYATAPTPTGPWTRYQGNPIISRANTQQNGSGHGDLLAGKDGEWYYVFHTHNSNTNVGNRKTAIVKVNISGDKPAVISVMDGSFRYLESGGK